MKKINLLTKAKIKYKFVRIYNYWDRYFRVYYKVVYLGMPTVLKIKGYRFFFFSLEGNEPAHIHVEQAERYAKFWLEPVQLAKSDGFRSSEITELRVLVEENKQLFKDRWNEYFSNKN